MSIDLGFAEKCEPWHVQSPLFPSKIGGKPAWLSLTNLPKTEDLQCKTCSKQTTFLCQIYAPYEDEDNFHRTLFVFICRNPSCCKTNEAGNVKVFRNSLRRQNQFYPFEPPVYDSKVKFDVAKWVNLCNACGCLGDKHCGKCKRAVYCCREHQIYDWKSGHKQNCALENVNSGLLFPEHEIVMENEEIIENEVNIDEELQKFRRLEAEGKTGTLKDVSEAELQAHTQIATDKVFSGFRKRVSEYPDQILRYEKGGEPLWIASEPKPDEIPNCESCGGLRQFEFQLMPQLLTVLKETDLDWGVLVFYTCKYSCRSNVDYKSEFVFKQDVMAV